MQGVPNSPNPHPSNLPRIGAGGDADQMLDEQRRGAALQLALGWHANLCANGNSPESSTLGHDAVIVAARDFEQYLIEG